MATANKNRVSVRKVYEIPDFAAKLENAKLPKTVNTTQTYRFTIHAVNRETNEILPETFVLTGTIQKLDVITSPENGNEIVDVMISVNPIWTAGGPSFSTGTVALSQVDDMTQMYVNMEQDKSRASTPSGHCQYTFVIDGKNIETDDFHFLKVVYRDADSMSRSRNAFGYLKGTEYNDEIGTTYMLMNCIELNHGAASYYKIKIDVDDLIGIYRYKITTEQFNPKNGIKKTTAGQDESGDILPSDDAMPANDTAQ